jgi:hypothetical protein
VVIQGRLSLVLKLIAVGGLGDLLVFRAAKAAPPFPLRKLEVGDRALYARALSDVGTLRRAGAFGREVGAQPGPRRCRRLSDPPVLPASARESSGELACTVARGD